MARRLQTLSRPKALIERHNSHSDRLGSHERDGTRTVGQILRRGAIVADPIAASITAMCGSELQLLPDGVQRVARWLSERGHAHAPVMLDGAARTAQQAADALGVRLGQIAKSIIFRRVQDNAAVLVITSGDLRVDEGKVAALLGELARADAAFVKAATGFSIGGVAPVAHQPLGNLGEQAAMHVLVDAQLARFDEIWAAAGHPYAVFRLTPADLGEWTSQALADVTAQAS